MKGFVLLILGLLILQGCDKKAVAEYPDYLTGDTAIFTGSWEWAYSDHFYGHCDNLSFYELITPLSSGDSQRLIFFPNGNLHHYKNDILVREYGLFFKGFYVTGACNLGPSNNSFGINLDNDENHRIFGCLSKDTLLIGSGFLYDDFVAGCETYTSYFVKQ